MVRPTKAGLDYFPLDTDMDSDDKIQLIEAEIPDSFGLIIKILMKIYKNGYFLRWDERTAKIFAKNNYKPVSEIIKLIEICVSEDLFSSDIFDEFGVLTSGGIQTRYFTAILRRKTVNVDRNLIIVDINSIVADKNLVIVDISTQSKVKKSKVKKSKVIKTKKKTFAKSNNLKKDTEKLKALESHEYFKNDKFSELWCKFKDTRGRKFTDIAKEMALTKLFRHDVDICITSLENSISSGWVGVFPESIKTNQNNQKGGYKSDYERKKELADSLDVGEETVSNDQIRDVEVNVFASNSEDIIKILEKRSL